MACQPVETFASPPSSLSETIRSLSYGEEFVGLIDDARAQVSFHVYF